MRAIPYLIVAASGALLSVALPPAGVWPLLLALVPLFVATAQAERPGEAFRLGFTFGLTFFTLYVLWLPSSFATPDFFGPLFWLLYPPLLLILAAFWGVVTLLARLLGGRGVWTLALLPPLWILMEWARTQGYFAFPWGTLGYAWLDTPVAQVADTVGVWGLGLLATSIAALTAAPFLAAASGASPAASAGRRAAPVLIALVLLVVAWNAGSGRLSRPVPVREHSALLVQGNVDPYGRLLGPTQEVEKQAGITRAAAEEMPGPPDLVIWPEGAVLSGFSGRQGKDVLARVQSSAPESVFLVGARASEGSVSFNSAYTVEHGELLDRYDKNYLVPFGERFPFAESAAPLYRGVFGLFGLPALASTGAGDSLEPLASPLGEIAAYICYESVFPQVQRAMVRDGAQLLVNITNDAWFSRGDGAAQHYAMGRMRAIETRRYLLRAGNDGITGAVDPFGRTLDRLPRGQSGAMNAPFAMLDEITPYVRYGHLLLPLLGLWIALALMVRLSLRQ